MELIAFTVVPGHNLILRRSVDSSLTVPWPQRIQELYNGRNTQTPYCGCGWPQHLLIPKGTTDGMIFDMFIMVTNGQEDAVAQLPAPAGAAANTCRPAPIYCGVPNQLYPDAKPMNYPFDRLPYMVQDIRVSPLGEQTVSPTPRMVRDLAEFVNGVPNIAAFQVS